MPDRRSAVAAWLEDNSPAPKVHVAFGAEWDIPAQMPVALWLWAQAEFWQQERNLITECRQSDLDEPIAILGLEPLILEWAGYGITIQQAYDQVHRIVLGYLYPQLFAEQQDDDSGGGDASGEASTSANSSPSTSDSSQPTGTASTEPTSPNPFETV